MNSCKRTAVIGLTALACMLAACSSENGDTSVDNTDSDAVIAA